jgi:hypothetical protein
MRSRIPSGGLTELLFCGAVCRPFCCLSAPEPKCRDTVYRSADQWIGQQSQKGCHDQVSAQRNSAEHDAFVDYVDHDCHDEDLSNLCPTFPQQFRPVSRGGNRPTIGRTPRSCVSPARASRKEGNCQRLQDQTKRKRPVRASDDLSPHSSEVFFHIRTAASFPDCAVTMDIAAT